jgi:hypothetical protein
MFIKAIPLLMLLMTPLCAAAALHVTIIEGLGGTEGYAEQFAEQMRRVAKAFTPLAGAARVKTFSGNQSTRENILAHFQKLRNTVTAGDRAAVILIGHGSYDGHVYKFNIPGPDLTGSDLLEIMNGLQAKPQLLINTSSASGALLQDLKNADRIIITATRGGTERNAPRFGAFFTGALSDPAADTDKNGAISAAEAFAYAERYTKDYYEAEGRLATEHPQLEGQRAELFQLARLTPARAAGPRPELGDLERQRLELSRAIEELRLRRDEYSDTNDYLNALQDLLLKLSAVEERIEAVEKRSGNESGAE